MDATTESSTWPPAIQQQLDQHLRDSAYTGIDSACRWLLDEGYEVARAVIYRYALALRSLDAAAGNIPALMLEHTRAARRQKEMSGCEPVGVRGEIVEDLLAWGARSVGLFGPISAPICV